MTLSSGTDFIRRRDGVCVFPKTATYTVKNTENGGIFTNSGATGAVEFDLPPAIAGLKYTFVRTAVQTMTLDPTDTHTIRGKGVGVSLSMDATGTIIELYCAESGVWDYIFRGTVS